MRPNELTAGAAGDAIRRGERTSERLVAACLERIAEAESRVGAWTWLDPDHAMAQARAADALQRSGAPLGALHGIPVGIKDIFDTADMPTENGTVLHAGRRPTEDATAVALLRAAGAVIMGKTVTAELAVHAPGKTTNPHDPQRTPGGSSSGSAAAVAANMVPLAIGTQTNGSVLRPASYCGVYGFKPSHGSISRHGVLKQSLALDHVGVFARSFDDVALIARELLVPDGKDPDVPPGSGLALDDWQFAQGRQPRIAFARTPQWPQASAAAQDAFLTLAAQWGGFVRDIELPARFASAIEWHRTIMEADLASSFAVEYASGKERLSPTLREMIERGQRHLAVDYSRARDGMAGLRLALASLFSQWDAVLTPATQGVAPLGLASTGSPMFCTIWTLCGVPAISLPILRGEDGLPLGVQVVAGQGDDANLLRIAKWLVQRRAGAVS